MNKNDKILDIDSTIETGKYKGRKVKNIVKDKHLIFELIKLGFQFDDNVLSCAGIKRHIRDVKIRQEFTKHVPDNKTYERDKTSLSRILKEIQTIEGEIQEEENVYEQD